MGIFSGVYPARFGSPNSNMGEHGYPNAQKCYFKSFWNNSKHYSKFPVSNFTSLGEAFQQEGYRTGYIGKWHLGNTLEHKGTPLNHGFDISIGASDAGGVKSHFYPFMKGHAK